MKSNPFTIAALAALLALISGAANNLAADPPDAGLKEIVVLQAQVTQLQERVEQLESRVDELSRPKLRPAEGQ